MDIFTRIDENQKLIKEGKYRYLPFNFSWMNKIVPGIIVDHMLIAGQSGAAKSSIAKFLYLIQSVELAIEKKLSYHVLMFCLEDMELHIDYTILCNLYWKKYKEIIDSKLLEGLRFNKDNSIKQLTPLQRERLDTLKPQLAQYKSYITVIDDTYLPDDIYKKVLEYATKNGKFYKKNIQLTTTQVLSKQPFDKYVQNEECFVSVLTDNINLLDGEDLYKAMLYYSFEIGKKHIVKKLGYNFTVLQQLADANANLEHQKANDWLPSNNALGQAKKVGKDSRCSLGISCPGHYSQVKTFMGYSVELMRTYLRILNVFKQSVGIDSFSFPMIFIPQVTQFYLLPILKKGEEIPEDTVNFITDILTKIKEYEEI